MKNWSTDTKRLQEDPRQLTIWKLEQLINYGLDGEKLPEQELRHYFDELSIDPLKKKFLDHLLWPSQF